MDIVSPIRQFVVYRTSILKHSVMNLWSSHIYLHVILQNKIGIFGSTLFWAFGLSLAMKLPPSKRFVPLVLWAFSGLVYYFDEWYGKTLQELSDNHGQRGIGVYVHSAFCLFQLSVIYLARESSSPTAAKEKSN